VTGHLETRALSAGITDDRKTSISCAKIICVHRHSSWKSAQPGSTAMHPRPWLVHPR